MVISHETMVISHEKMVISHEKMVDLSIVMLVITRPGMLKKTPAEKAAPRRDARPRRCWLWVVDLAD